MSSEEGLIFLTEKQNSPKLSPKFFQYPPQLKPLHGNSYALMKNIESPIKFVRFKVKKNLLPRARSNSPKEDDLAEKKTEDIETEENKCEFKESGKKFEKICKEFEYLCKNEISNRKGFEICLEIIENTRKFKIENQDLLLEKAREYLESLVFVQDPKITKKLEVSLNKNSIFFQGSLWKEIVKELCDLKLEEKEVHIQKLQSMENEKNKLSDFLKEKENDNLINGLDQLQDTKTLINFLRKENDSFKEKMKNMEIFIQKISIENCKLKEAHQYQLELITREKEELLKNNENCIAEINKKLEESKKGIFEKETEISNLKNIHGNVIDDYKRMIQTMRSTKEKILKYEDKVSILMKENQNLKGREAMSYEELTPRPMFRKVNNFFINDLKYNKFKEIFELSDSFFENKSSKKLADDLFKICKNYILTEFTDRSNKRRSSEKKNECFSSFLSIKSTMEASPESQNSRSVKFLENPVEKIEFDEILQNKKENPNLKLQILIPDRIPKGDPSKKELLTPNNSSLSPKRKKNLNSCKMLAKQQKKSQSP